MQKMESELSSLIGDVYAAAATPALWPAFLRRLEVATKSSRSYVHAIQPNLESAVALQSNFDPHLAELYARRYAHRDELVKAYEAARREAGGVFVASTRALLSDSALHRLEGYQEFMAPMGDQHLCAMLVGAPGSGSVSLALRRGRGRPEFGPDTINLLALLAPHVCQAVALQGKLAEIEDRAAVFEGSADAFGVAVLAIGRDKRMLLASRKAEAMLGDARGLHLSGGRLCAARPAENVRLQTLLHAAIGLHTGDLLHCRSGLRRQSTPEGTQAAQVTPFAGGAMRVHGRTGCPLMLTISPFDGARAGLNAASIAAVVFVGERTVRSVASAELLGDIFAATATEIRLAAQLLEGVELKQAGDCLGLSYDAVRFHLKQLYRKTGCRGHADLMRLLLLLPGGRSDS